MAKKGVVIFDGEDMFINPKKAIYSKTRGESKSANGFVSARGDEEGEPDGPQGRERIVRNGETTGGGGATPVTQPTPVTTPPVVNQPVENVNQASANRKAVEPDTPIIVNVPRAEVPTIVVPPILPPNYVAPTPDIPTRPTPPQRPGGRDAIDPISGGRYSGDENNPGSNQPPLYVIDDGTPAKPVIDTPRYVAPVPALPEVKAPPAAVIIADPLGGGGSPLLGDNKEVPKVNCGKGFVLNAAGICTPIVEDPCAGFPIPQLAEPTYGMRWTQNKKTCTWEQVPDGTIKDDIKISDTTTTTTKKGDEILTPATSSTTTTTTKSTSTTDTTTTKKSVKCNPPIYAPPRGTRWKDLGNCTFTTEVDPNFKDSAPVPPLPGTPGQPIFNINLGGLGTVPTIPTKPEPKPSGDDAGGGGGGGGTPFPEEPAPVVEEAPKKNYFWWYVGGALAIFLLIKRKKSQ